jgi:DNA-binding transcriptional ArsR family regulator
MPEEFDNDNCSEFKNIEDYNKTLEGTKYFHSLYLKAVNHPIRREILEIIHRSSRISESELFEQLKEKGLLDNPTTFRYNIDFLLKALCIDRTQENEVYWYQITQAGKVIEYLK